MVNRKVKQKTNQDISYLNTSFMAIRVTCQRLGFGAEFAESDAHATI